MDIAEFKKDTVYRQLRSAIMSREYLHNHKFSRELDFSKELGVGKVTLRAALEKLEKEGLVARLPSRGTYVTYKKGQEDDTSSILLLTDHLNAMENPYLYILPGIQERATEISRRTTICPMRYLLSQNGSELRGMVRANNIAGAVVLGANFKGGEPLIGALKSMNIPVVIAHASAEDRKITGFATVRTDFRASWKTAIRHLAERGHEKVATLILGRVGKNIRDYSEDEHLGLLSSFGMDADNELIFSADYDRQSVFREINSFLKKTGAKPTAILCYSDFMAIYLYEALKEMRIRVPQDIAVMGYCGYPGSELLSPKLSTVDFQYTKIGAASLDLIAAADTWSGLDTEVATPEIFVDYVLQERESSSIKRIEKNFKNKRGIMKKRKLMAFTIVELLVVISIIAILAAILMPALSKAKQQASRISCVSNLKQCGVATYSYTDDFQGWIPFSFDATAGATYSGYATVNGPAWFYLLASYVNLEPRDGAFSGLGKTYAQRPTQPIVFTCPAHQLGFPNSSPTSYAPGIRVANMAPLANNLKRGKIQTVRQTASKAWLNEWQWGTTNVEYPAVSLNEGFIIPGNVNNNFGTRHNGSGNILFFDGHANWVSLPEIMSPSSGTIVFRGIFDTYADN